MVIETHPTKARWACAVMKLGMILAIMSKPRVIAPKKYAIATTKNLIVGSNFSLIENIVSNMI